MEREVGIKLERARNAIGSSAVFILRTIKVQPKTAKIGSLRAT